LKPVELAQKCLDLKPEFSTNLISALQKQAGLMAELCRRLPLSPQKPK